MFNEIAEDCPLADYGGYLSSDDNLDLHPNFQGESSLVQMPHRWQLPLLNKIFQISKLLGPEKKY